MIKKIFILFLVFFLTLSAVYAEYSSCPEGDINMDKVADFYAKALKDKQIRIALCEARFDESSPDDFESFEEYMKNYEENYCRLTTGYSLLDSNFNEHDGLDWQSLYITEAIKGTFDRIVVYYEFGAMLGRLYPAFDAPNFAPLYESKWIVVFKYDPKGEKVIFFKRTPPRGEKVAHGKTLPVLELASREFGIIRYDAPNHLDIDAEKFLLDLRSLVGYTKDKKELSPGQLNTELGRKIFACLDK